MPSKDASFRKMASQAMAQAAKQLRQKQTVAEQRLWYCLRGRHLGNAKFRRQHPVADTNYVVDFFCYQQQLIIELDGVIHKYQQKADIKRQRILENHGYRVLRFSNQEILNNLEGVLTKIAQALEPEH